MTTTTLAELLADHDLRHLATWLDDMGAESIQDLADLTLTDLADQGVPLTHTASDHEF